MVRNAALGATLRHDGTNFAVWSADADQVWLCLFDEDDHETGRIAMQREGDLHRAVVPRLGEGARYGVRADGRYAPDEGLCFDPAKLLVDPYALRIDRPFVHDPALMARRGDGPDTAPLVPKAIVQPAPPRVSQLPGGIGPGAFIYEVPVRGYTMRHPQVPPARRGTLAALAEPAVLDHLSRLGVDAVELMPIAAWIDERHLPALGLRNAWGYNPVAMMALDPRLAPGGIADLADAVAALHERGIAVILDVVFNHTGESDRHGATLSMRGLGERHYFRRNGDGTLANDTGTGNTLDCTQPVVQALVLDTMRHFVRHAGIDGFRFDLAPILGRDGHGFDPQAPLIAAMLADPELSRCMLIAEPWDIGPGGYQLGNFPGRFLEWNDRYRDDVRRFWRGDGGIGALATCLAGSTDLFGGETTRSVNFVAAHDGMTLADLTAFAHKHNHANGEDNRDGHDDNLSWNCGSEGASDDAAVTEARRRDIRAMLTTLVASRGVIMLTAGDEFGRTQHGNNNAYAQDNEITWLDWQGRDRALEDFAFRLFPLRRRLGLLRAIDTLTGGSHDASPDVRWLDEDGQPMTVERWEEPGRRRLAMLLAAPDTSVAILVNGGMDAAHFRLPDDYNWTAHEGASPDTGGWSVPPRTIAILSMEPA